MFFYCCVSVSFNVNVISAMIPFGVMFRAVLMGIPNQNTSFWAARSFSGLWFPLQIILARFFIAFRFVVI